MPRPSRHENPGIKVNPIYAGSYTDTLTKAQTAAKAGQAPTMAVLLSTDAYTLIDDGLILPFDEVGRHQGVARPISTPPSCATRRSTGTNGAFRSSAPPS